MRLEVPAEVIEGGSITAPARKLLEIVRELPSGDVRISASGDRIEIDYGRGSYRIAGLPAEEFPSLPEISDDYFTMDAELLVEMIEKTSFAASTEESQYFFDGVYFHMLPGSVRMVASDGRRLAMINEPVDLPLKEEMGVIIPLKAVKEFADNFEDAGEVRISIQENQIVFQAEGKTLAKLAAYRGWSWLTASGTLPLDDPLLCRPRLVAAPGVELSPDAATLRLGRLRHPRCSFLVPRPGY